MLSTDKFDEVDDIDEENEFLAILWMDNRAMFEEEEFKSVRDECMRAVGKYWKPLRIGPKDMWFIEVQI